MLVEPAAPEDEPAIRALFRATVLLGHSLAFDAPAATLLDAYEHLCLGVYVDAPRPGVVGVLRTTPGGPPRGYAVVCLQDAALRTRRRRALAHFAVVAAPTLLPGQPHEVSAFVRSRLADAWELGRTPRAVRGLPHAHLNAAPDQGGLPGRALADFVDEVCRTAGRHAWYGEINARAGRRAAVIVRRWGAEIVHRAPNRTLSRLVNEPVERLTIRRVVPSPNGAKVLHAA